MRVFLIIVMVLGFLATAGLGLMIAQKNLLSDEAKMADALVAAASESAAGAAMSAEIEALKGFKMSGYAGVAHSLLALLVVIFAFAKKDKLVLVLLLLTIVGAGAFIALSPAFEGGLGGGADARTQAMIIGIAGLVTALCGFGAAKMGAKAAA